MGIFDTIKKWFAGITGRKPTAEPTQKQPEDTTKKPEEQAQLQPPEQPKQPQPNKKAEDLKKAIKPQGTTRTIQRGIQTTGMPHGIIAEYEMLLKDKVTDPQLIQDIIRYREPLLRHRINTVLELEMTGDGGEQYYGQITVAGTLIEDEEQIQHEFEGSTGYIYTINTEAETRMKAKGLQIRKSIVTQNESPLKSEVTLHITGISRNFQ